MSKAQRPSSRNAAPSSQSAKSGAARGRSSVSVAMLVRAQAEVDAGDRCAAAGERERALGHYGRALNEYLREGLFGLAASVARRMIDRYPDVVRARMTLAALTLSEGLRLLSAGGMRSTCAEFHEYVQAAQAAGQAELATRQLRRFAEATESVAVRTKIAEFLAQLGDAQGARAALPELSGEEVPTPTDPADQRARWIEILLAPIADVGTTSRAG